MKKPAPKNRTGTGERQANFSTVDKAIPYFESWRGYRNRPLQELAKRGFFTLCNNKPAFPIRDASGRIVGHHVRAFDGYKNTSTGRNGKPIKWFINPPDIPLTPTVIGNLDKAREVHFHEGDWDAGAYLDVYGFKDHTAVVITHGALNIEHLKSYAWPSTAKLYAWPQTDKAGEEWLVRLHNTVGRELHVARISPSFKDLNDFIKQKNFNDKKLYQVVKKAEVLPAPKRKAKSSHEQAYGKNGAQAPEDEGPSWLEVLDRTIVSGAEFCSLKLPPRDLLLGDWFAEKDCGFIFAERGVGKTWFGLGVAAALGCGGQFGPRKARAPVKVLYLDAEMPADLMQSRAAGFGIREIPNVLLLQHEVLFQRMAEEAVRKSTMNLANADLRQGLTDYCVREGVKAFVIDNLSASTFGVKENEADAWEILLPWLLDLRRRGVAVPIIHHAGRAGWMRGTTKREDAVAWTIKLVDRRKHTEGEGKDKRGARFVSTFDKPSRNTQEALVAYEWHFVTETNGTVTVGWEVSDYDPNAPKGVGRKKTVPDKELLALLPLEKSAWRKTAEEKLNMPRQTFRDRFNELLDARRIQKDEKDGTWYDTY